MYEEFEFEGKRLIVGDIHSQEDFSDFMGLLRLKSPFIVKPNWICRDHCHYTDPQILEWSLRSLSENGEVIIVESYSARNMMALPNLKPSLMLSDIERMRVRESEEDFLKETGIKGLIEDLGIEYVNVAEEVLERKTVEEEVVRELVERKFPPVLRDELYSFLPEKLYEARGGTLISLAKLKLFFTMCTKNMFGLIPEYVGYGSRFARYHGNGNTELSQNIVDVNKIYRSIFDVVGLVDMNIQVGIVQCPTRAIPAGQKQLQIVSTSGNG